MQLVDFCLNHGEQPSPVFSDEEVPSTTVQYGFSGVCGAAVQDLLDIGFAPCATGGGPDELQIDGQDGSLTNAAVICMQKQLGLQDNGQVGPITWSWLLTAIG
ncbi:peptidoglycan-binding protein [Streptacidiphilus sp. 4-A2]|nr:peptidoglycan-binding protein [Streptacidiphilus sp. 4-A2]